MIEQSVENSSNIVSNIKHDNKSIDTLSVVVPCYNEQDNLPSLVKRISDSVIKLNINFEIVLVDDGSQDKTKAIIKDLSEENDFVIGVFHKVNQGIAGAWQSGINNAKFNYVCFIDADLQNVPEDINRLYKEIQHTQCDFVQGSRSAIERTEGTRTAISKLLNVMLNSLFGMSLNDNKSGFVLARKDVLQDVLSHKLSYHYFQTFIAIAANAKGYSIRQIETLFQERKAGESFLTDFPLWVILKVFKDMAVAFWEYRIKNQKSDVLDVFVKKHLDEVDRTKLIKYKGRRKFLYSSFFATMPLHKWLIRRPVKYIKEKLELTQWFKPETIKELQEFKLRKMISHAYYHVPYYRELLDKNGIDPRSIRTIEDLASIPMLGKGDVRENLYFDLFSSVHDKSKILKISTSGSTGEPFVCYADKRQLEYRMASTFRAMEWSGWRFGDRQARLWHQTIGMKPIQVFKEYLDAWFMKRMFVPAYELKDDNIPKFLEKIKKHNPVLIDGYAESFNFLSSFAKTHDVAGIRPKAIMSSAQIMPDNVRNNIENEFETKVYDKYGSREFSGIAYECEEQDGHHIQAESYIVEIIKDGRPAKPGELGEVVITDLNNFCTPLIRYRVGDLAVAMDNEESCKCGRGLPRVGRIEGRTQAIIRGTNGSWLPGTFFAHYFKECEHAIRQYQVIQNELGKLQLKVVKGDLYSEDELNKIVDGLKPFLGEDIDIDVDLVDEVPLGRTGKRTSVISNIKYDFQDVE